MKYELELRLREFLCYVAGIGMYTLGSSLHNDPGYGLLLCFTAGFAWACSHEAAFKRGELKAREANNL